RSAHRRARCGLRGTRNAAAAARVRETRIVAAAAYARGDQHKDCVAKQDSHAREPNPAPALRKYLRSFFAHVERAYAGPLPGRAPVRECDCDDRAWCAQTPRSAVDRGDEIWCRLRSNGATGCAIPQYAMPRDREHPGSTRRLTTGTPVARSTRRRAERA